MNYEQLWKGLKEKCEDTAKRYEDTLKAYKGKDISKLPNFEQVRVKTLEDSANLYEHITLEMSGLERKQTLSDREVIENAIDELKRDRLFERYRIKYLKFSMGEEGKWDYKYATVENYHDYHLYSSCCHWFIVFHDGDNVIFSITFDNVEIKYWEEKN